MGESWPRSPVQTERSEVCTSDRGQDSPIQTDLARLIRCLLYGQTRKQRNKNINNFIASLRGLKHLAGFLLSLVSSPNGTKVQLCTNFVNEWRQNSVFIQVQWKSLWLKQQFMKRDEKCNCNVSNTCLCLDRSAISSHSVLRSSTDHHRKRC